MEVFYRNRPGAITPGEAATIAAVVDTFVRATKTSGLETESARASRKRERNVRHPSGRAIQSIGENLR